MAWDMSRQTTYFTIEVSRDIPQAINMGERSECRNKINSKFKNAEEKRPDVKRIANKQEEQQLIFSSDTIHSFFLDF